MSIQTVPDFKALLRQGHRDAELSVQELWFQYRLAGGRYGHPAVRAWIMEDTLPVIDQYVILAGVINTRLTELGKTDRLVPSVDAWVARESNPEPTGSMALAA